MLLLKLLAPIITLIIALYDLFEKKRTKKIKPQLWWKKPIIWVLFVASIISGLTIYFDNNAQDNLNKSNDMLLNNQKELQKQNDSLMTVVKNIDNKANNQKIISELQYTMKYNQPAPYWYLER